MSDIQDLLQAITRPGLLVRAARHGVLHYDRARHLPRILGSDGPLQPGAAARRLIDIEEQHETRRCAADAAYNVQRHIEVLCALMTEARLMGAADQTEAPAQANASDMPAFLRAV